MKRPTIGARVVRGLNHIYSLVLTELQSGDHGPFHKQNGFEGDRDDVYAALQYIAALAAWFEGRNKKDQP